MIYAVTLRKWLANDTLTAEETAELMAWAMNLRIELGRFELRGGGSELPNLLDVKVEKAVVDYTIAIYPSLRVSIRIALYSGIPLLTGVASNLPETKGSGDYAWVTVSRPSLFFWTAQHPTLWLAFGHIAALREEVKALTEAAAGTPGEEPKRPWGKGRAALTDG